MEKVFGGNGNKGGNDQYYIKEEMESGPGLSVGDDMDKISDDKHVNSSCANSEEVQQIEGPLSAEKRFMLYICGGYEDTVEERSAIMENVYPRLYLYCKQRGYDFAMVDLRWGIGTPVSECHDTIELHVETIQRCQKMLGLNFIVFVGQEYNDWSLPSTISRDVFEAIVRVLEKDRQQTYPDKQVVKLSVTGSQSSIATDRSSGSFDQYSIYRNYLNFGEDEAIHSGLLSQSSHDLSDGEEEESGPGSVGAGICTDMEEDLTLLQMYYKLDENCLPPVYRLAPIR